MYVQEANGLTLLQMTQEFTEAKGMEFSFYANGEQINKITTSISDYRRLEGEINQAWRTAHAIQTQTPALSMNGPL